MKADTVLNKPCSVGRFQATIIGYIEWNNKIQYVWVKFSETEELLSVKDVNYD